MNAGSVKVYDGPSLIDGQRIVVVLTGLRKRSKNTKTGDMVQSWILRYDTAPHVAIRTGADRSVCGSCPLRRFTAGPGQDRCYVRPHEAPLSVWRAHRDAPVAPLEAVRTALAGRKVRRGSYGDPGAVPAGVWAALDNGGVSTGYTHRWRDTGAGLQGRVMASVHGPEEAREAWALGWRTFRVLAPGEAPLRGEVTCPASKEAGQRTTCERCGLCDGSRGAADRRKSVVIAAH